jgi:cob(I)alamin adenosyltransferase
MSIPNRRKQRPPLKITRLTPKHRKGLVVVITGNGKGKTSSALGMILRACGHGMKSSMVQFMKGDIYAGEWDGVKKLSSDVELIPTGMGFCGIEGNPYSHAEHREAAQRALRLAKEKIESGPFDIVVLDEINNALKLRLVDLEQVLNLITHKPPSLHLILTGRDAHPRVMALADTVSEVREIKHAYREGVEPQPGIDY